MYASGQVAFDGDRLVSKGKVPSQVGVEAATQAAALCAANVLRAVRKRLGSLDRIERVLRITGYVKADPDFTDEHLVINGASQLVRDVWRSGPSRTHRLRPGSIAPGFFGGSGNDLENPEGVTRRLGLLEFAH